MTSSPASNYVHLVATRPSFRYVLVLRAMARIHSAYLGLRVPLRLLASVLRTLDSPLYLTTTFISMSTQLRVIELTISVPLLP